MPVGYSGTPLAKKLGIKEGFSVLLYNAPDHYLDLFTDFPDNVTIFKSPNNTQIDFIHLFCMTFQELREVSEQYKPMLKKNGMLWISWPKGSSKLNTDLKRDPIREQLLAIGLVDVKVAAIDENWSGLKFVYRIKDRK
ncbi:MAG: DUF3052 domain-containing protein [Allomuricauda sp.]